MVINRILAPLGLSLSRRRHDWADVSAFIPFDETMSNARESGLSLGEYIDLRQGIAGATQATIDEMKKLGIFQRPVQAIVEIGPGTGRYLERTLQECSPERYEIYEIAPEWAAYLSRTYPVIVQPTDGSSLQATATGSIDLAHAHKVFSTITFVATAAYWREMGRVVREGGHVVFDVMTEHCLPPAVVEAWTRRGIPTRSSYPAAMPREAALGFFRARGFELIGSFLSPMPPGQTEVLAFRKVAAAR
jgi:SAM-dependent methyltransferase